MSNKYNDVKLSGICSRCGCKCEVWNPKEYKKGLHASKNKSSKSKVNKGINYTLCSTCLNRIV